MCGPCKLERPSVWFQGFFPALESVQFDCKKLRALTAVMLAQVPNLAADLQILPGSCQRLTKIGLFPVNAKRRASSHHFQLPRWHLYSHWDQDSAQHFAIGEQLANVSASHGVLVSEGSEYLRSVLRRIAFQHVWRKVTLRQRSVSSNYRPFLQPDRVHLGGVHSRISPWMGYSCELLSLSSLFVS